MVSAGLRGHFVWVNKVFNVNQAWEPLLKPVLSQGRVVSLVD